MTEVSDINTEGKVHSTGEEKQLSHFNRGQEDNDRNFEPEEVLASLAHDNETEEKHSQEAPSANQSIDVDHNEIRNAAFGTQGDVIFNYFGDHPDSKNKQPIDPTEPTLKQTEDIPELNKYPQLAEVESILLDRRIVIIEQNANNHLLVSNLVRKIRFDHQNKYKLRDAQKAIDTTQYCKHCHYDSPTITTLMPQRDTGTLLPLLHQDEFDRIRQRLTENNNYLLVITQLNIDRLKQKVIPPVESDVYVWSPDKSTTGTQAIEQQHSLEQELDSLFQSELKIQPYVVFTLGFFPGLSLDQFNQVIHYWLERFPELLEEPANTKSSSSDSSSDNDEQIQNNSQVKTTYSWNIDGDSIIRKSHGVFVEDAGWGKGYYYKSPRHTQALQQLLIARYPNYCQQHFNDLLPLFLQSPNIWHRFRDHYKNTFINFINQKLHILDHHWLIKLYEQQRQKSDDLGFWRFVELLRALSVDPQGSVLVKAFHLSLADKLTTKQNAWRKQIEQSERYNTGVLSEFQQEVADYVRTIAGSCGFSEEYIAPILQGFLEKSALPFSSPMHNKDNDDLETVLCPLSWYSKYQINSSLFRDHTDFFAIVKRFLQSQNGEIDGKSPLGIRSGMFQCYFVAVKAIEYEADQRSKPQKNDTEDPDKMPAVIHDLLSHTYNSGIFVNLIFSQLNIVRDVSNSEVYEKWLSHQLFLLENIVLIALTSDDWNEDTYAAGLQSLCTLLLKQLPKQEARLIRLQNRERLIALQDRYHHAIDHYTKPQRLAIKIRLTAAKTLRSYFKNQSVQDV